MPVSPRRRKAAGIGLATSALFVVAFTAATPSHKSSPPAANVDNKSQVKPQAQVKTPVGLNGRPEDSPSATRQHMSSLTWGEGLPTDRIAVGLFAGGRVRVVPALNANRVNWTEALGNGKPGHFVAKIRNQANRPIPRLGLGPLETGYLWVGEITIRPTTKVLVGSRARGAAIYRIGSDGVVIGTPTRVMISGYCKELHLGSAAKLTNGARCPSFTSAAFPGPKIMLAARRDTTPDPGGGLWVTCAGGCCEVKAMPM